MSSASAWACGRCAEQRLVLDEVDAAVAPGVAAKQPPGGQHDSSQHTVAADRLDGVLGAGRMVLAARGKRGRDRALVEADRRDRERRGQRSRRRLLAGGQAGLGEHRAAAPARSPARRRRARARRPRAGRRSRSRGPAAALGVGPEGLAQQALDRGCARPRRRACGRPRHPSRGSVSSSDARKRVDDQVAARVRAALAVDAVELAAARQPAALAARAVGHAPRASAACGPCAAALQHVPAGARAHARAEAVGAGALALLGLIGALHEDRERRRARPGHRAPRAEGTLGGRRSTASRASVGASGFSRVLRGSPAGGATRALGRRCTLALAEGSRWPC